uniref:Uncharacterized protein n=1 Tax=Ficedula albicollis TaxID=59894 RepID=A0A803V3R8_FICAL
MRGLCTGPEQDGLVWLGYSGAEVPWFSPFLGNCSHYSGLGNLLRKLSPGSSRQLPGNARPHLRGARRRCPGQGPAPARPQGTGT